jgi:hypothetical protein
MMSERHPLFRPFLFARCSLCDFSISAPCNDRLERDEFGLNRIRIPESGLF